MIGQALYPKRFRHIIQHEGGIFDQQAALVALNLPQLILTHIPAPLQGQDLMIAFYN